MTRLMRFPSAVRRDPAVDTWMQEHSGPLGSIARQWFEVMRDCGDGVRELLHDGHPTACVGDAAFGYVNVPAIHHERFTVREPGGSMLTVLSSHVEGRAV